MDLTMMETQSIKTAGLFIDGREQSALSGEVFAVYAPADGNVIGYAARATAADADRVVESARNAADGWSRLPPAERERIMLRAADLLESRTDELLSLVIDESGSTLTKARYEIVYSA